MIFYRALPWITHTNLDPPTLLLSWSMQKWCQNLWCIWPVWEVYMMVDDGRSDEMSVWSRHVAILWQKISKPYILDPIGEINTSIWWWENVTKEVWIAMMSKWWSWWVRCCSCCWYYHNNHAVCIKVALVSMGLMCRVNKHNHYYV